MKSFRRWSRDRRNQSRDGNLYSMARYDAHKEGIKIVDKKNLEGYTLDTCYALRDGQVEVCVRASLVSYSDLSSTWIKYAEVLADNMTDARMFARRMIKNLK